MLIWSLLFDIFHKELIIIPYSLGHIKADLFKLLMRVTLSSVEIWIQIWIVPNHFPLFVNFVLMGCISMFTVHKSSNDIGRFTWVLSLFGISVHLWSIRIAIFLAGWGVWCCRIQINGFVIIYGWRCYRPRNLISHRGLKEQPLLLRHPVKDVDMLPKSCAYWRDSPIVMSLILCFWVWGIKMELIGSEHWRFAIVC